MRHQHFLYDLVLILKLLVRTSKMTVCRSASVVCNYLNTREHGPDDNGVTDNGLSIFVYTGTKMYDKRELL